MAFLSICLGFVFGFHLCIAGLQLVEPIQDINVTEGSSANFSCTVTGRSAEEYSIIWFVHNQTAGEVYFDINASPTRTISSVDFTGFNKESFKRFEVISVQHYLDGDIERSILIIPAVNKNDSDFRFQCIVSIPSISTRTSLSSWATITVQPAQKVSSTLPTPSTVSQVTSATRAATNSSAAIGGSISAVLIILMLVIVVIIFYKKRKNMYMWFSRNQNKSGGNTIAPSDSAKSEGTVNNGFLYKPNKDINTPSRTTNIQDEIPTSSDFRRQTSSSVPIYAMPDKTKSSAGLSSNTTKEDSSNHEIPTYALPNKRKTMVADYNQIPVYAKPDKKLNDQNEKHGQGENLEIYYSQVPKMSNGPNDKHDNTDVAYSVVNVENQTDIIETRNAEGLAYADVSFSDQDNSVKVPSNSSQSACTYSPVNY